MVDDDRVSVDPHQIAHLVAVQELSVGQQQEDLVPRAVLLRSDCRQHIFRWELDRVEGVLVLRCVRSVDLFGEVTLSHPVVVAIGSHE